MGKALSIMSLVFGLVSLALSPLIYLLASFFLFIILANIISVLAGVGIVFGAIGIKKGDVKGLAIAGLVISSIAMVNFIAGFLLNFIGVTGHFFMYL